MCFFLFFKHKTAYEMRISDWSSDVCSSDLARGDWTEKVEGIEAGADDYLAKPFQMGELVARVRGLVRRGAGKLSPVIEIGRLRLDTVRMSASFDGARSEEHTSELLSLMRISYAVFCLKKKTYTILILSHLSDT